MITAIVRLLWYVYRGSGCSCDCDHAYNDGEGEGESGGVKMRKMRVDDGIASGFGV